MSELMRRVQGEVRTPIRERSVVQAARAVHADAQITGFKIDADAALAGHIMETTVELDHYRQALCAPDSPVAAALVQVEMTFIRKAMRHQQHFGDGIQL